MDNQNDWLDKYCQGHPYLLHFMNGLNTLKWLWSQLMLTSVIIISSPDFVKILELHKFDEGLYPI